MEGNKLQWLRGPPPPISESILTSGLMNQSTTQSTKITFNKTQNNIMNNQKKVFQSAPAPYFKTQKIPFRPKHVLSIKPKKDNIFDQALKPFYPPIDPEPQLAKNYKAPPLDETTLATKKMALSLPPENLTQKVLMPKQSNYREFIQELVQELDSNIASAVHVSPEIISPEEQAHAKLQVIEFYNYAFNQLILKEKTISADKAILLRRFMKFYNQILSDFPFIIENLESKNEHLNEQMNILEAQVDNLRQKIDENNDSIQKVEENNRKISEDFEKAVKESNSKDITISTLSYDNDLTKSQLNKLQFKYNKLKEENENLTKSLSLRDDEIKGQLGQIEKVTAKLAEYQQGDTGYIVMYHKEKEKTEKYVKEIENLKQKIYDLENIEKVSIAVDTSDIPVKKLKKKKMTKSPSNGNVTSATSSTVIRDENQRARESQGLKSKSSLAVTLTDVSIETDLKELITLSIEKEAVTFSIDSTEIIETEIEKVKPNSPSIIISDYLNKLNVPDGYDEKLKQIPPLDKFIMPLFSDVYLPACQKDLKIFAYKSDQKASQNEKPLIWGLQMIHTFLTDPSVRSIENKARLSTEDIVVDWIVNKYKVQHLVHLAISDFSRILSVYRYDQMVELFIDIIEGSYNFSQLSFLSTVYSFACTLTIPDVSQVYQSFESTENEEIKIHIKAVHKLYSLCFSEDVADEIVRSFISENCEMVNFTSFLRKITSFFGEKHKLISNQAHDLLCMIGCSDTSIILFDVFESFMVLLGCFSSATIKSDWKCILNKTEHRENQFITVGEMLEFCAENDQHLQNLLNIPNLKKSLSRMKNMSQIIYEFYHEFIGRFAKKLPFVLSLLSSEIKEKVSNLVHKLKEAVLEMDIQKMIWLYKKLISKIDRLKMKEMGFIPFNYSADTESISKLIQYINKAEEVSFAMLS